MRSARNDWKTRIFCGGKTVEIEDVNSAFYSILGLPPEAGGNEIRSAYRRLAKQYHPDHDNSLDAQIKYREIRTAYDALRNRPQFLRPRQPTYENFRDAYKGYGMGRDTGWEARDEEDVFHVYGQKRTPPKRPEPKVRRPFLWSALPGVIWESLNEIAGMELFIRAAVTSCLLWWVLAPVSRVLAILAIFFSFCGSAVFRYYYTREPQDKGVYFLASLYYGLGMSAIFVLWSFFISARRDFFVIKFLYHIFVIYTLILPLWVHPLAWTISEK
jgi:hypothetical protein